MAEKKKRIRSIVLRQAKLKETDLIVTLLCDDGTRIDALARGARKPGGRLAGRTELFDETDFLITQSRGLGILSEAQLISDHHLLRYDLDATSAAACIIELARFTSFEDAPDPYLYPICAKVLTSLEEVLKKEPALPRSLFDCLIAAYTFKVLAHGGWRPILSECVFCGDATPSRFSVAAGGCVCESCSRDVEGAEPLTTQERRHLELLIGSTFDEILEWDIAEEESAFLVALAHGWAQTHLDAHLRSFEFYLNR